MLLCNFKSAIQDDVQGDRCQCNLTTTASTDAANAEGPFDQRRIKEVPRC
jgi:hypothetical protein